MQPYPQKDNQTHLNQLKLNLEVRSKKSRFPWRGQFSPDLIDYLIEILCPKSTSILDPFCGSGTVLFEALAKGKTAYGIEVNPAAWHLANLAKITTLPAQERDSILFEIRKLAAEATNPQEAAFQEKDPLFLMSKMTLLSHPFWAEVIASIILLAMGNGTTMAVGAIGRATFSVLTLLDSLYNFKNSATCVLGDARAIPLEAESIDAIITSPPYINVFNYHQNYRPATELIGWRPLEAAKSEIGANRKHRTNRFLTVTQYCLDMSQCLNEANRVLSPHAPLIIVLGRTSNVLGTSFENSNIIQKLICSSGGFSDLNIHERVFTNRFGERIYEDIIVGYRMNRNDISLDAARDIATSTLEAALNRVPDKNKASLEQAIEANSGVKPSPMFNISTPNVFLSPTQRNFLNGSC